jgi:hypothetical protein
MLSPEARLREDRSQIQTPSQERPFARLGFWAATAGAVGAVLYGVNSLEIGFAITSAITWHGYASFIASYNPWIKVAVLIQLSPSTARTNRTRARRTGTSHVAPRQRLVSWPIDQFRPPQPVGTSVFGGAAGVASCGSWTAIPSGPAAR